MSLSQFSRRQDDICLCVSTLEPPDDELMIPASSFQKSRAISQFLAQNSSLGLTLQRFISSGSTLRASDCTVESLFKKKGENLLDLCPPLAFLSILAQSPLSPLCTQIPLFLTFFKCYRVKSYSGQTYPITFMVTRGVELKQFLVDVYLQDAVLFVRMIWSGTLPEINEGKSWAGPHHSP